MGFIKTIAVVGFLMVLTSSAQAKDVSVCVEVKLVQGKSEGAEQSQKTRSRVTAYRLTPQAYLK